MKTSKTSVILASAGALGGLYYAFKKGKGFWGYAGFFVLGSIAGHLAGNVITAVIPQPKKDGTKDTTPSDETNEEVSNASGTIGANSCASSNDSICSQNCQNMGGTFNASGDRKCYKNGVAISGGQFGGIRANRQIR